MTLSSSSICNYSRHSKEYPRSLLLPVVVGGCCYCIADGAEDAFASCIRWTRMRTDVMAACWRWRRRIHVCVILRGRGLFVNERKDGRTDSTVCFDSLDRMWHVIACHGSVTVSHGTWDGERADVSPCFLCIDLPMLQDFYGHVETSAVGIQTTIHPNKKCTSSTAPQDEIYFYSHGGFGCCYTPKTSYATSTHKQVAATTNFEIQQTPQEKKKQSWMKSIFCWYSCLSR